MSEGGNPTKIVLNQWYDLVIPMVNIPANTSTNITYGRVITAAAKINGIIAAWLATLIPANTPANGIAKVKGFSCWGPIGGQLSITQSQMEPAVPTFNSSSASSTIQDALQNSWFDAGTNSSRPVIQEMWPDRDQRSFYFDSVFTDSTERTFLTITPTFVTNDANDNGTILYVHMSFRDNTNRVPDMVVPTTQQVNITEISFTAAPDTVNNEITFNFNYAPVNVINDTTVNFEILDITNTVTVMDETEIIPQNTGLQKEVTIALPDSIIFQAQCTLNGAVIFNGTDTFGNNESVTHYISQCAFPIVTGVAKV